MRFCFALSFNKVLLLFYNQADDQPLLLQFLKWRSEIFKLRMFLFSKGKGAMKAQRCWKFCSNGDFDNNRDTHRIQKNKKKQYTDEDLPCLLSHALANHV